MIKVSVNHEIPVQVNNDNKQTQLISFLKAKKKLTSVAEYAPPHNGKIIRLGTKNIIINFCISFAPGLKTLYSVSWNGVDNNVAAKKQHPANDDGKDIPFVLNIALMIKSVKINNVDERSAFVNGFDVKF